MTTERLRVLLVSKKTEQALQLRDNLSNNSGYIVRFEETAEAAMNLIVQGTMSCVIFNFEHFGPTQVKLIEGIRQVTKIFQILIFTDQADADSVGKVKDVKSLIIIEKPLLNLDKDLTGLCERLIGGEEIYQRESKRLPTFQRAEFEFMDTGDVVEGVVVDLSNKGACLQMNMAGFKVGSRLKVTIDLDKLGLKRIVICEVRWVKSVPGRCVAGVRFVK